MLWLPATKGLLLSWLVIFAHFEAVTVNDKSHLLHNFQIAMTMFHLYCGYLCCHIYYSKLTPCAVLTFATDGEVLLNAAGLGHAAGG